MFSQRNQRSSELHQDLRAALVDPMSANHEIQAIEQLVYSSLGQFFAQLKHVSSRKALEDLHGWGC